jgi:hypothetical protein
MLALSDIPLPELRVLLNNQEIFVWLWKGIRDFLFSTSSRAAL